LLINNHKIFAFKSVIHEVIYCKSTSFKYELLDGNYFIISGRSGNRNLDKNKYLNDALLLECEYKKALSINDDLFERYAFYCANSYHDHGDYNMALKWFDTTLKHENQWVQEKYISCLYSFNCCIKTNQFEKGLSYLVKGLYYDSERVETLYPLLVYYYKEKMYKIAYNYYLIVKPHYETNYINKPLNNKLFMYIDKYDFYIPYFMILISCQLKELNCAFNMFNIIFKKQYPFFNENCITNLFINLESVMDFIEKSQKDIFLKNINNYVSFLKLNNFNISLLNLKYTVTE
jgi:tetratricopeptide (TPR) repeat protein